MIMNSLSLRTALWVPIVCFLCIVQIKAQVTSQPLIKSKNIDSTFFSKIFLKANLSANYPFNGLPTETNLFSISFFHTIKNSISQEFGFTGARNEKKDNGNSWTTNFNLNTVYQFSYIFLHRQRIRPYLSFKSRQVWYYNEYKANITSGYERGGTAFGLQHWSSLAPGTLIVVNKHVLVDLSINLFSNLLFVDNGYRYNYTKNPGVPADQQNVGQLWFDYFVQPNLNIPNGIYLNVGLIVKMEK